jgi:hypothetical protein
VVVVVKRDGAVLAEVTSRFVDAPCFAAQAIITIIVASSTV